MQRAMLLLSMSNALALGLRMASSNIFWRDVKYERNII